MGREVTALRAALLHDPIAGLPWARLDRAAARVSPWLMRIRFVLCAALVGCGSASHAASDPVTIEVAPAASASPVEPAPSASAVARKPPEAPKPEPASKDTPPELEMVMLGALGSSAPSRVLSASGAGPVPVGTAGLAGVGTGAPAGPNNGVRLGAASVRDGDVVNASAVIAGMAAGFRRCLRKAHQTDPNGVKDGTQAEVIAKLGPSGEVISTKLGRATVLSNVATACILARVQAAQFAPPDTGTATITIPLTALVQ
jgi:hypothetical protein